MDRLPARLEVDSLLRSAQLRGEFGTVLRPGDEQRGSIIILVAERGQHAACLERNLDANGRYHWHVTGPDKSATAAEMADWTAKRVRFDDDVWLIELDVVDAERFVAETLSGA